MLLTPRAFLRYNHPVYKRRHWAWGKVPPEAGEICITTSFQGSSLPRGLLPGDVFTGLFFQPCVFAAVCAFERAGQFPVDAELCLTLRPATKGVFFLLFYELHEVKCYRALN